MPHDTTQLIHYTRDAATVGSILRNGFLLIPSRRELLAALVENRADWDKEPQEWGMVSFTELPIADSTSHRQVFGDFGVAVSWDWALKHGVDRVIYIRQDGALFETWRFLFTSAYRDVKRREEEGPLSWGGMSSHNRAMAQTIGAAGWATMLRFFEYMQPDRDSAQVEWRIVNKLPFTFSSRDKQSRIQEALQLAGTWQTANLRVQPADIRYLVCPAGAEPELRAHLPADFCRSAVYTFPC